MGDAMEHSAWVWQGWFGPMAAVTAAKAITDQDARAGAWVPEPGRPPARVNLAGTIGMIAVMTRPDAQIPDPAGLEQADSSIVGRLIGG